MFPRADSKLAQGSAALPAGLQLRWAAGSDIGHRRRENQDSFLATPPLFLVADGMGGHAGGAQASATLLQTLARLLVVAPARGEGGVLVRGEDGGKGASVADAPAAPPEPGADAPPLFAPSTQSPHSDPAVLDVSAPLAPTPNTPNTQAPDFWTALDQACFRVIDLSEAREDYTLSPPGTTLTGLVLRSELCEVINVGDSRTYVIENGMMTQLTRDHSQVAELVEAGIITKAQARTSPNRSVITRAIGAGQNHPPLVDRWTRPLRAGQRFLICTDGLTSLLDDGEILRFAGLSPTDSARLPDPSLTVSALINRALNLGGHDNITVIVLDVLPAPVEDVASVPAQGCAPTKAQTPPPPPPAPPAPPPPPAPPQPPAATPNTAPKTPEENPHD